MATRSQHLRRLGIGAGVTALLLLLIVGGFIAYTYFFGATPITTTAPTAVKPQINAPHKAQAVDPNAKVGVSVQTISSPVKPGDNSAVSIRTLANIGCTIDVQYNGVKSTDSGLAPKKSDEYGLATWSWTVGSDVPTGTWPVTITCAHDDQSGVVTSNLVVSKTAGDE